MQPQSQVEHRPKYRRSGNFVYRAVAGEHLLVALHRDRTAPLFTLSATGAAIWQCLDEWCSEDAVVSFVVHRFEVEPAVAAEDVREFLEQLRSIGAVEEVSE